MNSLKNWAGNLTYSTSDIHHPEKTDDIVRLVKKSRKLRVLGTRHCFNRIADSDNSLLSTARLNTIFDLDTMARTVTVGAGITYGALSTYLHENGFALPNLASLPHISIAGACATATHGSGVTNGNLATSVSGIELVTGAGNIVRLSREKNTEIFEGSVVNLGALGVVTQLTLDIIPAFTMTQHVFIDLPMARLAQSFDEIMASGYSVSLFTDWQTDAINQVWIKRMTGGANLKPGPSFFGARAAEQDVHPIKEMSAVNCTGQMGVAGPWYDRLPHFRMGFTPSSGEELQAEYFVNRAHAVAAIRAVAELRHQLKHYLMISEIRAIASDQYWLSPCYEQDSVAIHFTLRQDISGVAGLLPAIEEVLDPFEVRPHWGKLFSIAPERLASRYSRMKDFRELMTEYDPGRKFSNTFIETNIL